MQVSAHVMLEDYDLYIYIFWLFVIIHFLEPFQFIFR
uniref:Uncharacterized protein n=1 Tax=Rhizophora mucronata TaxID=61149 RepID=A0A2P2QY78_RHIMU